MNDEETNVTEVTENVEAQTTEEIEESIELTDTADAESSEEEQSVEEKEEDSKPKGRYVTDDELNEIVDKRVARKMSKLEREKEKELAPYRDTENVLNSVLGTSNMEEANTQLRSYYKEQGIDVPDRVVNQYSKRETEILAKADANDIIEDGYNAMVEEAEKLANIGYANMNDREKVIFNTLAEKLTEEKDKKELLKLGAKEELLQDKDFQDFRKQFNVNVPVKTIYELYTNNKPKPKVENPGSMRNVTTPNTVKDFYSYEEASKFTREDFDKNPKLFEAVEKSSYKW